MTTLTWIAIAAGAAVAIALARWAPCAHEVAVRQKRDPLGRVLKPHTLEWHCMKCLRVVGETQLPPKFKLIARLRRQQTTSQEPVRRSA